MIVCRITVCIPLVSNTLASKCDDLIPPHPSPAGYCSLVLGNSSQSSRKYQIVLNLLYIEICLIGIYRPGIVILNRYENVAHGLVGIIPIELELELHPCGIGIQIGPIVVI